MELDTDLSVVGPVAVRCTELIIGMLNKHHLLTAFDNRESDTKAEQQLQGFHLAPSAMI